jgi:1-acyl-sn-glycerol-3-phosphate acyltransferase
MLEYTEQLIARGSKMIHQGITDKLKLISEPLPFLTMGQRWFLKSFLLCFGQLVQTENFDPQVINDDPLIFAFNHNCSYETLLVPIYLTALRQGRKIGFIIDWMFGRLPGLSWVFQQTDPIYVYNKKSTLEFLNRLRPKNRPATVYAECIKRLENGRSIGIFPEGSRNRNPELLLKGHKGIGYIALHSQAPVLPIGIDFPSRIKKGRIPKFGPLILRTGSKMYFPEERAIYQQINSSPCINHLTKKILTDYLTAKTTYSIMKKLANLSGKQYPFQEPAPPALMKRFLFDPALIPICKHQDQY